MRHRTALATVSLLAVLMIAAPPEARAQAPTLGIALGQSTYRPAETLDIGVTVNNPGGGPAADFYVLIVLPDGATTVSIRLGAPIVFGSLGNLRSLVPAAANIGLGGPFTFGQSVFRYTFAGNEPAGSYAVYFAALRAGALANGLIDAGELLALQTQSFVFTTAPGVPTVTIDQTAVLLPQVGATRQLTVTATDGAGRPFTGAITWTSSRPGQVAVDGTGLVRALVANGSSQITAHAGASASAPLLVIATQAPAGATVITDAQIVGGPIETTPDAPPSATNTFRVVLRGVPPPAVGSLLLNTGDQPVAGRVLALSVNGDDVTVTLGLASLRELFPTLTIDELMDLSHAPIEVTPDVSAAYNVARSGNTFTFTPKPGATFRSPDGPDHAGPLAPVGTRAMFPFQCESTVALPFRLSTPPAFSVTINPTLDVLYTASGGLERFIVRATPAASADLGLTFTAAFEGKFECNVDLFTYRVPVGGPLSLVIGGLVPVGVGFEVAGKVTVATLGASVKTQVSTTTAIGVACPNGTACSFVKEVGPPSLTLTPTLNAPSLGDVRLEPSVFVFGSVTASIGNPFLKSLRLDAFRVKAGGKLLGSFASAASQLADPIYRSDYRVQFDARATVGPKLGEVALLLGVGPISALELALIADLARSPRPAAANAVTADRASFTVGETVTFTVRLDPSTVDFFPGIGPYNVSQVVLVRGQTNLSIAATATATPGQTQFTIPFTAAGPGTADEFSAFLITKLLPFQVFALEIGTAAGLPGLVVTSAGMTASVDADLPTRPHATVFDEKTVFGPSQTVSASMNEQVTTGGTTFRAFSTSTATRAVTLGAGGATITGSSSVDPRLSTQPPQAGTVASTTASSGQSVCFNLSVPFVASYSVQSNAQNFSDKFTTQLRLSTGGTQQSAGAGDSGSVVLPASSSACISFSVGPWGCSLDFQGNPQCQVPNPPGTPGPLTGSYTVTLSPAP